MNIINTQNKLFYKLMDSIYALQYKINNIKKAIIHVYIYL